MTDKRNKWLVFYVVDRRGTTDKRYDPNKVYVWFEYYLDKDVTTKEELQDFIDNLGNEIVVSYIAETDNRGNITKNDFNELMDIKNRFNKNDIQMFKTSSPFNRDKTEYFLDHKNNPKDAKLLRVNKYMGNFSNHKITRNLRSFSIKAQKVISKYYSDDYFHREWLPKGYDYHAVSATDSTFEIINFNISGGKKVYKGKSFKTAVKKAWKDCYDWNVSDGASSSWRPKVPNEVLSHFGFKSVDELLGL